MFESLTHSDDNLDKDDFMKSYQGSNAPNNIVPIPDVTVVKVLDNNAIRVSNDVAVLLRVCYNIYKNLVNYIWASALTMQSSGTEYMTDDNKMKRLMTYNETAVSFKDHPDFTLETIGLNVGPHSMEKLRILKLQNELSHLKNSVGRLNYKDQKKAGTIVPFFANWKSIITPVLLIVCILVATFILWKYYTKYRSKKSTPETLQQNQTLCLKLSLNKFQKRIPQKNTRRTEKKRKSIRITDDISNEDESNSPSKQYSFVDFPVEDEPEGSPDFKKIEALIMDSDVPLLPDDKFVEGNGKKFTTL
ncbi:unnamed protein product [Phytophthora fragariaefolia]|uniref:Unnamed protein product n=1 Tax=Phytophthora fragariaefolia TaxID=1490495 RepID=A0A9W6XNB0_9STRA|nr:unnamed protein product [Phytophthora fragariaefolia]